MKKLVVCCDGTWNWPDQDHPTNVVKTVRALAPDDAGGRPQIVYYDAGVGSSGSRLRRLLDGALGTGLSQNVQDAYRFLADNYREGDQLYFLGFSRGAYTVRSLAGLIGQVGLLHKGDMHLFPDAYALYRTPRKTSTEKARRAVAERAFLDKLLGRGPGRDGHEDRRRFPLITLLGVWDTVGSLGIPAGTLPLVGRLWPNFHDTELNCFVENAYQALAVDEQRRMFEPAVWRKRTTDEPPADPRRAYVRPSEQRVEQVWFPGAHSNVGGGYADAGLSDLAWGWMLDRARRHGLAFDEAYLRGKLRGTALGALVDSWDGLPWRAWPRYSRPLCAGETERLHRAVGERARAGLVDGRPPFEPHPYRPQGLEALLRRDPSRPAIEHWSEAG